jgi:hypothetical protein
MSKSAVRANARALPEAERPPQPAQTAEELQALASDFEAAFQAQRPFFYGSGTDEEADAATARVDEIARKIVALPTTDIEMMRLKARIYLWSEATDFKTFAAKNEGDGSSEAVLASLFRDLGVAGLDATPGPATMADRAAAQHEARMNAATPASSESERDRRYSRAFMDLEPKIRDLTHSDRIVTSLFTAVRWPRRAEASGRRGAS